MNSDQGKIWYGIGLDNRDLQADAAQTKSIFKNIGNTAAAEGARIDNKFKKVGAVLGTYLSARALADFSNQMIQVRGQFQQLEISFSTMLKSKDKAKQLISDLSQFAATTPFGLQSSASAAKQLLAYGSSVETLIDEMRMLGDVAAGTNQPIGDLVYLYGTLRTQGRAYMMDIRQFAGRGIPIYDELAKVLNTSKDKVNEFVSAGKVGFAEIEKAFKNMTSAGGMYGGLMEAQSKSVLGRMEQLKDAIDIMFNEIGKSSEGAIYSAFSAASLLVENYEKVGKILTALVVTYGAYRTAVMLASISLKGWTIAELAHYNVLLIVEQAQKLLNKTMLSNPYVAIATVIMGLVTAMWALRDSSKSTEKAQERLNNAIKDMNAAIEGEMAVLDLMFSRLKRATEGTDEYADAKKAIFDKYGSHLSSMSDEQRALMTTTELYNTLATSIKAVAEARAQEQFISDAATRKSNEQTSSKQEILRLLTKEKGQDVGDKLFLQVRSIIEDTKKTTDNRYLETAGLLQKNGLEKYIGSGKKLSDLLLQYLKAEHEFNNDIRASESLFGKLISQDSKTGEDEIPPPNYGEAYNAAKKEWEAAKKKLEDIERDKGKFTQKRYEDAKTTEEEARKKFADLGGQTNEREIAKSDNDLNQQKLYIAERTKQIQEYGDKVAKESEKAELDIRQRTIDAMDDSFDKQKAQIQLNYDKLEQENKERKEAMVKALQENERLEWENGNPNYKQEGLVFTPTKTEKDLSDEQIKMLQSYEQLANAYKEKADGDLLKQETDAMNNYLSLYGDYQQRKLAITELYNQKIAAATTTGEKLTLGEQMKKELYDLEMEMNTTTSSIGQLFGNMRGLAASDLRKIADDAEKALNFVQEGKWDDAKGLSLGISKETFDILLKSPEEMSKVRDGIDRTRDSADELEPALKKIGIGIKNLFHSGGDTDEFQKALGEINSGMNDILQLGGFLSDAFSNLGDALGSDALSGIAEGINVAMDTVNSAMQGAQAGAMFGPIGAAAGAALGAVSSLVSSIARIHDKKHERQIELLQDQIDTLERSYAKLGKSIDKAYSSDASQLIAQQNKMLEQQKRLIEQQIREENGKKKSDQNRIKEWQEQIEDINDTIADNKEKQIDAIFGQDIQSAIDEFAQAYSDAWTSNEDRTKTAADFIRNQIRNAITEAIKADMAAPIDLVRKKITEALSDGRISDDEEAYLDALMQQEMAKLDNKYSWADKYYTEQGSRSAVEQGIATASQDSVDELNGRFTAIQGHTFSINESVKVLAANSIQVLRHLAGIEYNTARLETIEAGISSIKAGINDMNIKGIKLR